MDTTAIQQVLAEATSQPINPHRLERRLESNREFAITALERAQNDLTSLLDHLRDDDTWTIYAREFAGHAGYSGTIQALVSEGLARLAIATGIVEGTC